MSKIQTTVISARVPVDVMSSINSICKQKGVNRSQWLTEMVATEQSNNFFKEGGTIQARSIPKELEDMLIAGGVGLVGILSYNIVVDQLRKARNEEGKPKFTENEITFIGTMIGVAIAMGGYGIFKALVSEK